MSILFIFVSGFQKLIYIYVRQLEMPKIAFQKVTSSPFPVFFFYHCTAKYKDIALKFGMCVVCVLV